MQGLSNTAVSFMADGVLIRSSVPSTRQPILRTPGSSARPSLNEISLAIDGIRIVLFWWGIFRGSITFRATRSIWAEAFRPFHGAVAAANGLTFVKSDVTITLSAPFTVLRHACSCCAWGADFEVLCRNLPMEGLSTLFAAGVKDFLNRRSAVRLCPGHQPSQSLLAKLRLPMLL
jgi:hypothetical protein